MHPRMSEGSRGKFCMLGSDEDIRPVTVPSGLMNAWMRLSNSLYFSTLVRKVLASLFALRAARTCPANSAARSSWEAMSDRTFSDKDGLPVEVNSVKVTPRDENVSIREASEVLYRPEPWTG